jgi:transcriptional regulator with XRE-family HTH domain
VESIRRRAFGQALRTLRKQAGLSQEQLAAEGISRGHISEMERGERDPRLSMLFRLSGLLKVPLSVLVTEIERDYLRLTDRSQTENAAHITEMVVEQGILLVTISGTAEFNACLRIYRQVFSFSQENHVNRILMNVLAVVDGEVSTHQSHLIATEIAAYVAERQMGPDFKLAKVGRPPTVNEHDATVARERGANLKVFPTVEEARRWLDHS